MIDSPRNYNSTLAWAMANADALAALVEFVRLLPDMKVRLVSGSSPDTGVKIVQSQSNLELPLPLKFSRAIADVSGGSTVDTECRTALNQLLAALRATGQNPS